MQNKMKSRSRREAGYANADCCPWRAHSGELCSEQRVGVGEAYVRTVDVRGNWREFHFIYHTGTDHAAAWLLPIPSLERNESED
jgi:hypothetical protein